MRCASTAPERGRTGSSSTLARSLFVGLIAFVACSEEPDLDTPQTVDAHRDQAGAGLRTLTPVPGAQLNGEIGPGASHEWTWETEAGTYLHLALDQRGSDLYVDVQGPGKRAFPRIDTSLDATLTEPIVLVAEAAGTYRFRIGAFDPGRYTLRVIAHRVPTREDRTRASSHEVFFTARARRRQDPAGAAAAYRQAIAGWQRLGDAAQLARAWYELAESLPDGEQRIDSYARAAAGFAALADAAQQGWALHRLGGLRSRRGEIDTARTRYREALAAWRRTGDRHQIAFVAYDLAEIEWRLGRAQTALTLLEEARELTRDSPDRVQQAQVRTTLGSHYFYRGEAERGIREHQVALRLLPDEPSTASEQVMRQRAITLSSLAAKLPFAGERTTTVLQQALVLLEEARDLRLALGDPRGLATTVNNLGLIHELMNRPRPALEAFQEALAIYQRLERPDDAVVALAGRCRILARIDRPEAAWSCFEQALEGARRVSYQNIEAQILLGLTRLARRGGDLATADARIGEALDVVEAIRGETDRADLRASFLARKYDYYELAVDVSLDRHGAEPSAGHAARAFYTLERARARGFLEALVRARPELEPTPLRRALHEEIHRLTVAGLRSPAAREVRRDRIATLFDRIYDETTPATLVDPPIVDAGEAQRLLDDETLLLVYHLGETRSAVWAFTDRDLTVRFLAPRAEIEGVARRLHEAMAAGSHRIRSRHGDHLATELSELILGPVADLLNRPHLAIVPTGALHVVPFAALPQPGRATGADPPPLLLHHRVTSTPSVSVLAALRRRSRHRPTAPELVAVAADPVLRGEDPRLAGRAAGTAPRLPANLTVPLPSSRAEAEAIRALTRGRDVWTATGFDANRAFALSPELGAYRILHFATHGYLDARRGELSGLVFSQFAADGRAVDGFLASYELYALNLAADLVVLSACQTALGEEIRGEGVLGLTRGFFSAGAARVLVTLWNVADRATARLMVHFYRGLLIGGLDSAEALRQAQIALRDEGFHEAYFWAPFIVQGDFADAPVFPRP